TLSRLVAATFGGVFGKESPAFRWRATCHTGQIGLFIVPAPTARLSKAGCRCFLLGFHVAGRHSRAALAIGGSADLRIAPGRFRQPALSSTCTDPWGPSAKPVRPPSHAPV